MIERREITTKEYLTDLIKRNARITSLKERQELLRSRAEKGTASYTAIRTGGTNQRSKVEDNACKLIEIERELDRELQEYGEKVPDVMRRIAMIPDQRYRDILTYRYLNGWKLKRIAKELSYEYVWTTKLHGFALLAFEKTKTRQQNTT